MTPPESRKRRACFVFDLHLGLPLRPAPLSGAGRNSAVSSYFETALGGPVRELADRAILPASDVLSAALDRGFACALSVSGTTVDLLEAHAPDALVALNRVAGHPRAEMLAAPYHHGIAGLIPDPAEFVDEVIRHGERMRAVFGAAPAVFSPPELCATGVMAGALAGTGCTALLTEPRWCRPRDLDPALVYRAGSTRVLLRHCALSDDLAARFFSPGWDCYPLSPETYAGWVAGTPGECVSIGLDLDLFGDERFLEFWEGLPDALAALDVETATPSGVLADHPADLLGPEREVSWSAPDGGETWLETIFQHSAAGALARAGAWLPVREVWRHLSSTDHFRAMAMRAGGCGRRQAAVDHGATVEAFARFMRALSALEGRSASRTHSRRAAMALRALAPEVAFVFSRDGCAVGYAAHSLAECLEQLAFTDERVVADHLARGDFFRWCEDVLGDRVLAGQVRECRNREELQQTMQGRADELVRRRSRSSAGSPSTP